MRNTFHSQQRAALIYIIKTHEKLTYYVRSTGIRHKALMHVALFLPNLYFQRVIWFYSRFWHILLGKTLNT